MPSREVVLGSNLPVLGIGSKVFPGPIY